MTIKLELDNWDSVTDMMTAFPLKTQLKMRKQGLASGAAKLRTRLRKHAPKKSGTLRKAIRVKRHKNGTVSVGLKERFYYKNLDFKYPRGGEYHPWFESALDAEQGGVLADMKTRVTSVLLQEAGKAYSQSRSKMKR